FAAAVAVLGALSAAAQTSGLARNPSNPVFFRADSLRYDRELGVMVATGHVEFTREDKTLLADTVSFNEKQDLVTASGNVTLLQATGEVAFADYVELTGDLKEGVSTSVRIRLQDDSRIAANSGRPTDGGNRLEMSRAVYSACDQCPDHPDRAPLWQLKARQVVHDQQTRNIVYNDAILEMWGIPVAYTP